jgi:hypothetical protein
MLVLRVMDNSFGDLAVALQRHGSQMGECGHDGAKRGARRAPGRLSL